MSETKKELRWFSIMDYEKEARYLSRMHQKGWKFKRVTMPGIYTFEKCEPEKVIYQLDYNQEGMKNQMEYVKMFEDCGWEYLLEFAGYSYFRKPEAQMSREEEIFCDDESRLDMMNRIFRGRVIPLIVIFCCLIVNGYDAMAGHGDECTYKRDWCINDFVHCYLFTIHIKIHFISAEDKVDVYYIDLKVKLFSIYQLSG